MPFFKVSFGERGLELFATSNGLNVMYNIFDDGKFRKLANPVVKLQLFHFLIETIFFAFVIA